MESKNIAVYGIYPSRQMVERAVDKLKEAGFRNTDISVLFPEAVGTKEFAVEKKTKAPEGAATGAGSGAVVGGALGWLVGIGLLAIPGFGPFIAAGPIMAALAGAGAGGLVGGIAGALIGMGIPEYEANRYEGRIKEGGILLSVHVDDRDWKNKGKDILEHTGAEDIGYKGESGADYDESDRPASDPVPAFPKKELDQWLKSHQTWGQDDWLNLLADLKAKGYGKLVGDKAGRDSVGLYLENTRSK